MRKFLLVLVGLVGMTTMTGCYEKIEAGNVGVKVHLLGSSKGVDNEVINVGREWVGWNEDLYIYPVYQQNKVWTKSSTEDSEIDESFNFQSAEGMVVNTDVGISYQIDPAKVSKLFQTYRKGPEEITNVVLRSVVRDGLNRVGGMDSVYTIMGPGKQKLIDNVQKYVKEQMEPVGITNIRLYLVSDMRPPAEVSKAIAAKITSTQRTQQSKNELEMAKAEAEKAIAVARGQAEANELKQKTLTPELIQYEAIQKWNGQLPSVTGGNIPFVNIK